MGLKEYLKRGYTYVTKGVPTKEVKVNIAQINYGGILKDKKVLITGGSRGLGLEIAKKCLNEQAKVTITGRIMDTLLQAKESLGNPKNLFFCQSLRFEKTVPRENLPPFKQYIMRCRAAMHLFRSTTF